MKHYVKMIKTLNWEEIKNFLQYKLKNSENIMTWGTIGSLNITNDIDTIITKKPSSPSDEFFKEVHNIFEKLDDYLNKNFKTRAVRFAQATQQYLVEGYTSEDKVLFHTMIYISFPEIEKDWGWALFKGEKIKDILKENYTCIHGNVNDLFAKDFQKENYFENIFIYLYIYDCLNSNLPQKISLNIMNGCFKYLYKKMLKIKNPIAKNRKEIKEFFYNLCKILDEKNRNCRR